MSVNSAECLEYLYLRGRDLAKYILKKLDLKRCLFVLRIWSDCETASLKMLVFITYLCAILDKV